MFEDTSKDEVVSSSVSASKGSVHQYSTSIQVTWAVKTTVAEVLGNHYVVPPPLALGDLLQLPAPTRGPAPPPPPTRHPPPLLLVTSAGVDPLEEVRVLGMPFTSVSLGQGQVGVVGCGMVYVV